MGSKVLIGIQARSDSDRLPRKAFAMIAGKPMLEWVVGTCRTASKYIADFNGAEAIVAVLTPTGDEIATGFRGKFEIREGSSFDVLARYKEAADWYNADLVVRITGDCPMIPPFTISRITALCIQNSYDYIANVDERYRTTLDGSDCEVMTYRMLEDCELRARELSDREHVTTFMRKDPPKWAKMAHVANHFDHSAIKLSVDTPEDLERVREAMTSGQEKLTAARAQFGAKAVHLL